LLAPIVHQDKAAELLALALQTQALIVLVDGVLGSTQAMHKQRSFVRSTTAEDGDMALALALDQAESQRAICSAEQPLHNYVSSLNGDPYHNPGKFRLLSSTAVEPFRGSTCARCFSCINTDHNC
jgi:hypothetical protein